MVNIYDLAFWLAIFFTVVGAILGLMGVWIKDFWKNELSPRLILTDVILAATSAIVAVLFKFLH